MLKLSVVCDRLGVSRSTVYRMVAAGDLPSPVKISIRRVGWLEQDIDDFLESKAAMRTPTHKKNGGGV